DAELPPKIGAPCPEVTICIHSQAVAVAGGDHQDAGSATREADGYWPSTLRLCPVAELTSRVKAPRPDVTATIDGEGVEGTGGDASDSCVRLREVFELHRYVALKDGARDT